MEQKGLEAAGVRSELVPDDFTEQDDGNIVVDLKRTHSVQICYVTVVLSNKWTQHVLGQWQYVSMATHYATLNLCVLFIYSMFNCFGDNRFYTEYYNLGQWWSKNTFPNFSFSNVTIWCFFSI